MDSLPEQLSQLDIDNDDNTEKFAWLQNENQPDPNLNTAVLCEWIRAGPFDRGIIRPYTFCDAAIVDALVAALQQQDYFTKKDKQSGGSRCNPYDLMGKLFFTTSNAIKCANMDALIAFSELPSTATVSTAPDEMLTYADVTFANDSGISEYLQWRKAECCRGYAFNTAQILWRNVAPDKRPTSELHRSNVSGNDPNSLRRFIAFVRDREPNGVYLAYSENMRQSINKNYRIAIRENWCKQHVLSYCALSVALLRPHGTAIVKIMDAFTPFTMGLIYLLRLCFEQMAVVKVI